VSNGQGYKSLDGRLEPNNLAGTLDKGGVGPAGSPKLKKRARRVFPQKWMPIGRGTQNGLIWQ